jgi:hypothetical protein
MEPLERLAAVEAAVKKLQEEFAAFKANNSSSAKQKDSAAAEPIAGRFAIEVPFDEDLTSWILVTDMGTGVPMTYSTREEAERIGRGWGVHRIKQL